ncbi:MAG: hypothetical protein ABI835_10870 [Chloroflexota bacterium]
MSDFVISNPIAQRLREIAERENRPVEDVLRAMMEKYTEQQSSNDALLAMDGMFDDDLMICRVSPVMM